MERKNFIKGIGAAGALLTLSPGIVSAFNKSGFARPPYSHRLPKTDVQYLQTCGYVEDGPVPEYRWASDKAYEDFQDIK